MKKSGFKMAKSKNSNDNQNYQIMAKELKEFNQLIKGHQKLLEAIGKL